MGDHEMSLLVSASRKTGPRPGLGPQCRTVRHEGLVEIRSYVGVIAIGAVSLWE